MLLTLYSSTYVVPENTVWVVESSGFKSEPSRGHNVNAKEREDLIKERKAEMENAKKGNKKGKTKKPINTGNIRDWAARSTPLAPRVTAAASSNTTATTSRPNSSLQIIPINPTTPSASPAVPIQNVANEVVVQTSASSTASSTIASAPHAVVPNPQDPT